MVPDLGLSCEVVAPANRTRPLSTSLVGPTTVANTTDMLNRCVTLTPHRALDPPAPAA